MLHRACADGEPSRPAGRCLPDTSYERPLPSAHDGSCADKMKFHKKTTMLTPIHSATLM